MTVSGADALLVIGLVALVLAFGAFAIIMRRLPARSQVLEGTEANTEEQRAAEEQAAHAGAQAQAGAEQIRARAQADADQILAKAAEQAAQQETDGRREAEDEVRAVKDEFRQLRSDLERREQRLGEREQRLDGESRRLEARGQALEGHRSELEERAKALGEQDAKAGKELERVAGLTAEQAKAELVAAMENQAKREAAVTLRDLEATARAEADKRARKIVTLAIQRVAVEQTSESVVSVMHLPGDDMKGRIIGREGRNIRAFESVTGVNL
ncbi:MAG: Rnase Y domain-containing protein, partial [Stellaceae bacterium]